MARKKIVLDSVKAREEALEAYFDGGGKLADITGAYHKWLLKNNPKESEKTREVAKMAYDELHVDGEVEIDRSEAVLSEGSDNGAYVSAWVWFSYAGTTYDKNK